MIPAAIVDLEFFLLISRKNSRISRRPVSGVVGAEDRGDEVEHPLSQASPKVGWPGASTIFSDLKTASAASASPGNSGGGISDCAATIRSSQSGQAVDQVVRPPSSPA
jgi:hypothetical protein